MAAGGQCQRGAGIRGAGAHARWRGGLLPGAPGGGPACRGDHVARHQGHPAGLPRDGQAPGAVRLRGAGGQPLLPHRTRRGDPGRGELRRPGGAPTADAPRGVAVARDLRE